MTPVDSTPDGSNRAHKHEPAPPLLLHPRHAELGQDEAGAQIDVERVVKLVDVNVQNIRDALAVARVGHEDVGALVPADGGVLLLELGEQPLNVRHRARVHGVHRDLALLVGPRRRQQVLDQVVYWLSVLVARQRQRGALGPQGAGTGGPDAIERAGVLASSSSFLSFFKTDTYPPDAPVISARRPLISLSTFAIAMMAGIPENDYLLSSV